MDLEASKKSVKDLVYQLEETMIRTAASLGVTADRNPANRGIWVGNRKMGSIGLAIRKGVTYHGLALNINLSLKPFGWINPCGLQSVEVTSIMQESNTRSITMATAQRIFKDQFENVFNSQLEPVALG
jgi:lipoate-protein ligase B